MRKTIRNSHLNGGGISLVLVPLEEEEVTCLQPTQKSRAMQFRKVQGGFVKQEGLKSVYLEDVSRDSCNFFPFFEVRKKYNFWNSHEFLSFPLKGILDQSCTK